MFHFGEAVWGMEGSLYEIEGDKAIKIECEWKRVKGVCGIEV
jgi:hypothetical protein